VLGGFAISALLLSTNWYLYIWAVNNDRIIDASLGYFINPLVNVLLGFLILRERLRPGQWTAVALAALGVAWLNWQGGHLPWIGLTLALTFGTYGLLRKTAALGPLEGLSLETMLLFPFAFGYLLYLMSQGHNPFAAASSTTQWLLAAAGPITAIPLLLFAAGARRIPLSVLGLQAGALHGWRRGTATSLMLIAAPWPLVLLAWSASSVSLARVACGEVALFAGCALLPSVGNGLRRWFARTESAMVASTGVGVVIAATVWASRALWTMPTP
jgi:hypothetical protein